MMSRINNVFAAWCVGGVYLVILAGCGEASRRTELEGTVTFDGEPLPKGSIAFHPQAGTSGPSAGGKIEDGRFVVDRQRGAFAGKFRVEITATRKNGKKEQTPFGTEVDGYDQYLLPRYNRQSELTAEVIADGPNQFEFALDSN